MTDTSQAELAEDTEAEPEVTAKGPGSRKRLIAVVVLAIVVIGLVVAGGVFLIGKGTSNKSDPKKASAALTAGLAAQTKGDLVTAAAEFNKVLKFDKNNKYAIYDLALIDSAQSNYGLAEAKYRRVLAIDTTYEPALFNLAILVQAKGDAKGAIALYSRAIKVAPKDASAHLNLGLLLRSTGKKAAGDAQVKLARTLNPKLVDPAR